MAEKVEFTATRVSRFKCPAGKAQAFLWDEKQPGLGLRVTANGSRAYVFEGKAGGRNLRVTIGSPDTWTIDAQKDSGGKVLRPGARQEAARLKSLCDMGIDPREQAREQARAQEERRIAERAKRQRQSVLGLDAWAAYRKDKEKHWSQWNRRDHLAFASQGGAKRKRGEGVTDPGPLHDLLKRPLAEIDADAVERWVKRETDVRPARAALGFRLLRAFINWCTEHREYAAIVQADACKRQATRKALAKPKAKDDALQREQLAAWFAEIRKEANPVISAYLQALLLTGARREEMMGLRWEDVDFQWKALRIRDKVEGERTIPLTPYVAHLLASLPRRNAWVFSSPTAKNGRLQDPNRNHTRAVRAAGLPHLTLHGLRRSFGTLAEWVEVPVGVVAQIQGHKPSAIAEKHYRVRPLDLLRQWHEKIEAWALGQAGVSFEATESRLRPVAVAARTGK